LRPRKTVQRAHFVLFPPTLYPYTRSPVRISRLVMREKTRSGPAAQEEDLFLSMLRRNSRRTDYDDDDDGERRNYCSFLLFSAFQSFFLN